MKAKPPFAVEWHSKSKFKPDADDDEWLSIVGQKKWIVFSHDQKWHDELANRTAIKQHSVGCFYLWGANSTTWEKLRCFARAYPEIERLASATARPFIYQVNFHSRIKRIPIP